MIFNALADYLKQKSPRVSCERHLANWLREILLQFPKLDNVSRIMNAEFTLQEIESGHTFFITPRSERAARLLCLMRDYARVMNEIRAEREAKVSSADQAKQAGRFESAGRLRQQRQLG